MNITQEVKSWLLEQIKEHSARQLWNTMISSGWDKELSGRTIETVLNIQLLEKKNDLHQNTLNNTTVKSKTQANICPVIEMNNIPNYLDAGDKNVSILAYIKDPQVIVFGDVLSHDECDALMEAARPQMKRSGVIDTKNGGEQIDESRTSNGMFFVKHNPIVEKLEARIAKITGWPENKGENLQVLQYRPGAEYKPHYDYFNEEYIESQKTIRSGGQRVATFLIYLNDPISGGGTIFPDINFEVMPKKGNGVFFTYPVPDKSSKSLHGGSPVIEGEKWVATKWLREDVFVKSS